MRHADVGRIDVPVDVEVADVAVALLADVVGEPADGQQVGRAIEGDAVVEVEPLAGQHLVGDRLEPRVVDYRVAIASSAQSPCRSSRKPVLRARHRHRGAPEQQEQETNIAVHGEKRSIETAQIVRVAPGSARRPAARQPRRFPPRPARARRSSPPARPSSAIMTTCMRASDQQSARAMPKRLGTE